ncbi:UvrD-helicase domain-containing protein [Candidatus Comchoanobacter bicostacola]|uniref:DNA 3'-5' helicase n=1 Tax=Candidatus Comchoanobacter bicostacola TaxID=2919598 RepID=A0ABY5DLF8_9GAMM|nr:UvrD-helicase domain-containing protein [Candidatus Comchoanobacter bicostacola]UTC24699.1 UvrD-helicase domain-containing protein [Candidatus Comchoanobacter bicostacola]
MNIIVSANKEILVDISEIIDTLNPQQREAATALRSNVLVLAGAGSGKTRTMVHRIAYLITTGQAHWHQILAVTFTNKAANELKHRVAKLLPQQQQSNLWTGTFHSICHKLLRIHSKECQLNDHFQVIDTDEQIRIIKKIHKKMQLDDKQWPHKKTLHHINAQKEHGMRAQDCYDESTVYLKTISELYQSYEKYCKTEHLVDFTELMLAVCELLESNESIRWRYQKQFKHILIDEFQDTNTLQYRLIKNLTGSEQCIFAVGDDDQSIYSWRGARVDHMFAFEKDFSPVTTVKLEQNYRSTKAILDAANHVIRNNEHRLAKSLWTDSEVGEKIKLYSAYNEIDEAQFVCEQIQTLRDDVRLQECAILYRSNAQSRIFEEKLSHMGIAYRVYGGLRFFDRSEIKDILAYLRLVANPDDNLAFERVVNLPPRGVGKVTLDKIRSYSLEHTCSLWQSLQIMLETQKSESLHQFTHIIEQAHTYRGNLQELITHIIDGSNIKAYWKNQKNIQADSKIENIDELVNAAKSYESQEPDYDPLSEFLSNVVLDQNREQMTQSDQVQLMTLHASKGLEFQYVFLVGVEEDLFPHKMTHADPAQVEEERRLCYVGMTRARTQLYISYAETRRQFGQEHYQRPSRFIQEIPQDALESIRLGNAQTAYPTQSNNAYHFKLGQTVFHKKFGEGIVLNYEEDGDNSRVHVRFSQAGAKWLLCAYANLANHPVT